MEEASPMRDPSSRGEARLALWLFVAALGVLACGCGDDGGGGKSANEVEFLDFREFELPYDTAQECILHSQTAGQLFDSTACACENCLDIMQECDVLKGCVAIRNCGFETGCRGAFECYLLPNAPCVDVINDFGNASAGAALSLALGECEMSTGCLE
jgi:hypothetical protein